jgi:hypothetical protein
MLAQLHELRQQKKIYEEFFKGIFLKRIRRKKLLSKMFPTGAT